MEVACHRTCCIILLVLLFAANANGQQKCKIEYYSTEQGLSHQAVTNMLKDREGFMWFGSWDGINRFDGHRFRSYKSSPGDNSQLGSDRIDQLVEDQSGHLWIEAYDKQIYCFDKKTEQFLSVATMIDPEGKQKIAFHKILAANNGLVWLQSINEGLFCLSQTDLVPGHFIRYNKKMPAGYRLSSDTINIFHEDKEHRIWIATPGGLSCLIAMAAGQYRNIDLPVVIASGENVTAIQEDAGNLYFGTASGKLITYDKKTGRFSFQKISVNCINAFRRSKLKAVLYASTSGGELIMMSLKEQDYRTFHIQPGAIKTIYEDRAGFLWIEPEKPGVIRFDPSSQSIQSFSQEIKDPYRFIGNRFKVFEDNNGIIWVNMKGGGFGYYNKARDSMCFVLNTVDQGSYRLPGIVYNLYYDKAGILWLRINGRELVKIIFQPNEFKQQLLTTSGEESLGNEVRGIYTDTQDRLWVGVRDGRLYVFKNGKRLTGLFENEPADGLGLVYSVLQDSHGNIWIGTKGNGLFRATPLDKGGTNYKLTHYKKDKSDPYGLQGDEIYSLLEDKQGHIWIGSFDEGLCMVERNVDSIKFIHTGNAFKNYPRVSFHKIRHMALDQQGIIWIGTTDGLLLLDSDERHSSAYSYVSYNKVPGDIQSLGNNNIQFIFCDEKNRKWLATSGGGFCQAIGDKPFQSLKFHNYTTKEGMPNDYVLSCTEDKQGNLWMATENGLSKFNPQNQQFRNYNSYDGLPRLGFSEAAVCHSSNGQLIFGTTKGYLTFDPSLINSNRIDAPIVFTNLQINNEDAGPGMNKSTLKTGINYLSTLSLKYSQNIISIDYAILDHRAGNDQEFAYRLIGFDSTWHDDRLLRRATYTNLPPGDYVFEVKNLSADLYSNQPYKRLAITILPPPWKTWWAYLLYLIVVVTILYFIRRYAVAMIRLRNKIAVEQKLAALKLNFFTNISHELRTPLTLIVSPLDQLARKENLSPAGAAYVEVARKNAGRMVRFINQLLDLRKIQSDKGVLQVSRVEIVSFIKRISDHFTDAAASKHITLEIVSQEEELFVWADADKLDVVIYNLLGNALKFSPEGKTIRIIVRSVIAEKRISIAVYDQGPGVPKNKLEDIFELFHEENHPDTKVLKGTGIGLALCREFVNLHGGDIRAENNEDGGLTVRVDLKLGTAHYSLRGVSFIETPGFHSPAAKELTGEPLVPLSFNNIQPVDTPASLVLLVEDNDELRSFVSSQLSEFYRVETARNGAEGLQKAMTLIPDLVISDIMMPEMNGIEMMDKIKNDVNTSHIPVVLLSARYSIESKLEGLKYGADYYITKPFNSEFLIASIDNLLRQRKKLFEALKEKKKSITLSPGPIVITSRDETFLKEVIKVVEDKMADTGFNIEIVAGAMAMSHKTFYKKFKSLTDTTPVEFVRDMRLQRAMQLLNSNQYAVSEVAYMVGFSNPKYFSTCFREKYDVAPSDYLKAKAK